MINEDIIFENSHIKIEIEKSTIPWFKIFSIKKYKEFSEASDIVKNHILLALDVIEKKMLEELNPTKINIASFGNYLPHLHFHIMARFQDDSHFPEPMWGKKQRDGISYVKNIDSFKKIVAIALGDINA
jgi:diadenosine tetraphosphate (Ap4A) HIT family hydrolase